MKKFIALLAILSFGAIEAITGAEARALQAQFEAVGIYNAAKPSDYNQAAADKILGELERGGFKALSDRLRVQQLKSLLTQINQERQSKDQLRSTNRRLQESFEQLRDQYSQLQTGKRREEETLRVLRDQNKLLQQELNAQEQQLQSQGQKIQQLQAQTGRSAQDLQKKLSQEQSEKAQIQQQLDQTQAQLNQAVQGFIKRQTELADRLKQERQDAVDQLRQQYEAQLQQARAGQVDVNAIRAQYEQQLRQKDAELAQRQADVQWQIQQERQQKEQELKAAQESLNKAQEELFMEKLRTQELAEVRAREAQARQELELLKQTGGAAQAEFQQKIDELKAQIEKEAEAKWRAEYERAKKRATEGVKKTSKLAQEKIKKVEAQSAAEKEELQKELQQAQKAAEDAKQAQVDELKKLREETSKKDLEVEMVKADLQKEKDAIRQISEELSTRRGELQRTKDELQAITRQAHYSQEQQELLEEQLRKIQEENQSLQSQLAQVGKVDPEELQKLRQQLEEKEKTLTKAMEGGYTLQDALDRTEDELVSVRRGLADKNRELERAKSELQELEKKQEELINKAVESTQEKLDSLAKQKEEADKKAENLEHELVMKGGEIEKTKREYEEKLKTADNLYEDRNKKVEELREKIKELKAKGQAAETESKRAEELEKQLEEQKKLQREEITRLKAEHQKALEDEKSIQEGLKEKSERMGLASWADITLKTDEIAKYKEENRKLAEKLAEAEGKLAQFFAEAGRTQGEVSPEFSINMLQTENKRLRSLVEKQAQALQQKGIGGAQLFKSEEWQKEVAGLRQKIEGLEEKNKKLQGALQRATALVKGKARDVGEQPLDVGTPSIARAQVRIAKLSEHPFYNNIELESPNVPATIRNHAGNTYELKDPKSLQVPAGESVEDIPSTKTEAEAATVRSEVFDLNKAAKEEAFKLSQTDATFMQKMADLAQDKDGIVLEGMCGNRFSKQGRIVLYTIHGTWSDKFAFGGDLVNSLTSYNLFRFACQLAAAYQRQVLVYSVNWTGSLKQEDRIEKSRLLASHVKVTSSVKGANDIWMIAHSHGCNVAAMAANRLKEDKKYGKLLTTGIFMASPTLDVPRPLDFKKVYAFYAQGDFTQAVGSAQLALNFDRKMPIYLEKDRVVYNVRMMLNGYDMDHVSIKWGVMPHLAQLIAEIDSFYPTYFDLEANVTENPFDWPQVAIRRTEANRGESQLSVQRSQKVKTAFEEKYGRDMSSIGVKYIRGLAWLGNIVREVASNFIYGEPKTPKEYYSKKVQSGSGAGPSTPPEKQREVGGSWVEIEK